MQINFTKQQIEERPSDYVCYECGCQFIDDSVRVHISTFFVGLCGLCLQEKSVTHIRSYNYLKPINESKL